MIQTHNYTEKSFEFLDLTWELGLTSKYFHQEFGPHSVYRDFQSELFYQDLSFPQWHRQASSAQGWVPHPWKHSRSAGMWLWATWSTYSCHCLLQRGWTWLDLNAGPLKLPSNPKNFMFPWICESLLLKWLQTIWSLFFLDFIFISIFRKHSLQILQRLNDPRYSPGRILLFHWFVSSQAQIVLIFLLWRLMLI